MVHKQVKIQFEQDDKLFVVVDIFVEEGVSTSYMVFKAVEVIKEKFGEDFKFNLFNAEILDYFVWYFNGYV